MTTPTSKSQIEKQFLAEMGTDISETETFEDLKVSETVSKAVIENIPANKKSTTKKSDKKSTPSIFAGISDQIYGILGSRVAKDIILPSITIQKKRIKKSLEKEQSKLISKAIKIKNAKKFRAHLLEETISQIRYLQDLIDTLFSFANKKITELYRRHYLKVG
jgi:phenylalanyl-tRNA synthetase alpha subunit